jgi:AcrR family transcriptional regulator
MPVNSPVDQNGRVLGARAKETRDRLMRATAELLGKRKVRELRVVEVARAVGSSPATFYQYFKDVEDVVLQLARAASDEMPAVVELIDRDWTGEDGIRYARDVVEQFIQHWDQHRDVLRVRNLASEEGDRRFQKVRSDALSPVLLALARKLEQREGERAAELHPHAAAAALAAILERLAAFHNELAVFGVTREDLVETSARIVHRTLTE